MFFIQKYTSKVFYDHKSFSFHLKRKLPKYSSNFESYTGTYAEQVFWVKYVLISMLANKTTIHQSSNDKDINTAFINVKTPYRLVNYIYKASIEKM